MCTDGVRFFKHIHSTLPVTRCLGLPALKAVSPELLLGTPTITSREVATPPDEGIIIASKGVFGVIGEREAISMLTGDRYCGDIILAMVSL